MRGLRVLVLGGLRAHLRGLAFLGLVGSDFSHCLALRGTPWLVNTEEGP